MVNGAKADEVRPVSLAQRNPRLSILGTKKKPLDEASSPQSPQSPQSKDAGRRLSLFQLQSASSDHSRNHSSDQLGVSEGHSVSVKGPGPDEHASDTGLAKKGSVRKRLSMLKLGVMKGNKGNMMGSLDEE